MAGGHRRRDLDERVLSGFEVFSAFNIRTTLHQPEAGATTLNAMQEKQRSQAAYDSISVKGGPLEDRLIQLEICAGFESTRPWSRV